VIGQLISSALFAVCTLVLFKGISVVIGRATGGRRRSEAADAVARAIATGEAVAIAAPDRLAVMVGCAEHLRDLIRATPGAERALQVWEDGLRRTTGAAADPSLSDPLALAACLTYCSDLAFEERMAASLSLQAVHDVDVPVGFFGLSGFLQQMPGYYQLQVHRQAGIADRLGKGEAVACPFCGLGDYDQTIIGCDRCTTDGGYVRTFPGWWTGGTRLPARIAPDPIAARDRSRHRHERMVRQLQQTR